MAIERKGQWIRTENGAWVNSSHLDMFEVAETDDEWVVRGWNALQPQVDPYILSKAKTEAAARKQLDALIEDLAGVAS